MRVAVLKESAAGESRVALSPDAVVRLIRRGIEVVIERGAGEAAFYPDQSYQDAGATVVATDEALKSDLIAAVRCPGTDRIEAMAEGAVVVALMAGATDLHLAAAANRRISMLALERVPRITRAQSMDVLSSQATVAGYQAVLIGAEHLPRFLPMLTTAAGSIAPARVMVLGAGVAGLQAIATARRLGAVVSGFDVRAAAAEQVESLGAKFIAPESLPGDAETAGGYARELAAAQQEMVLRAVSGAIATTDLVVSTAAIPGKAAPRLITREMVESMKPGSVIVDVAAETGGNCELTAPGQVVTHAGVTIVGRLNLAALLPQHASQMFGRNMQTLIDHLVDDQGKLELRLDDEITASMCTVHNGKPVAGEAR